MSTSYATSQPLSVAYLEAILDVAGLKLQDLSGGPQAGHKVIRTDGGFVHVYFDEVMVDGFERFGLNDPTEVLDRLEGHGFTVLSEYDDAYWDLPQNRSDED